MFCWFFYSNIRIRVHFVSDNTVIIQKNVLWIDNLYKFIWISKKKSPSFKGQAGMNKVTARCLSPHWNCTFALYRLWTLGIKSDQEHRILKRETYFSLLKSMEPLLLIFLAGSKQENALSRKAREQFNSAFQWHISRQWGSGSQLRSLLRYTKCSTRYLSLSFFPWKKKKHWFPWER